MVWIAGCWNSSNILLKSVIQRTFVDFLAFLEHSSAEKITVYAHTSRDLNKQEVGFSFGSLFKNSKLKLKNQKPIAVDDFIKVYPMIPLSCRYNLARRYLKT